MARLKNFTQEHVNIVATRVNVEIVKERAYGALQQLKDLRKEVRDAKKMMNDALLNRDNDAYEAGLRCLQTARDHWLRLVSYPTPPKLLRGEKPMEGVLTAGSAKGYLAEADVLSQEISEESSQP